MKLRHKLMILILAACTGAFGVCAGFFAVKMNAFTVKMATENNVRQMEAKDYVFSQMVTDTRFDAMGEIALEAYLKYQFRRCFGEGYALLKNQECLVNLTEFAILAPSLYEGDYMVQHLEDGQTVVLMERELSAFPQYQVLLVQDITDYEREMGKQMREYLGVCGGILAAAAAVVYLILGKILGPLRSLTDAAARLGDGDLKVRVCVKGKDEIGVLAEAFNGMAGRVEGQVEDLRLLLGALAHEIKTPMTSIIGYGESLLRLKLTKEQKEQALMGICRGGRRLERLCGKLLAMLGMYGISERAGSRSAGDGQEDSGEIRMETLSVREIFQEAVEELSLPIEEKGIQIVWEIGGEPEVKGDRELLVSLLYNLIHNSIKASATGGRIWLEADEEKLAVTDEGSGIKAEDLPHVWDAFFMSDKSRSRSEGGSGLGLALADRIVKLHYMNAVIESREGKGTRVIVAYRGRQAAQKYPD
ncbi:MAG: HAMP domain-containing histidine kinase [Hungatella sp.]|nr:HAMP domain-containing histidine kinase [Hungatella sp.]